MKKLIYSLTALLFSTTIVFSQHFAFPPLPSEPLDFDDSITSSILLVEVDPSVFPNQDGNFTEVTSVCSGDWSDPMIWDCECVPNSLNSVTIAETHEVTIDVNLVTHTLHIRPDAELVITPDLDLFVEVRGDIAIYGSLNFDGTELLLNGTNPQQMLGNISPSVMRCQGANEITNNGNLFVEKEFWLGDAEFFTNDNMFLTNTAETVVEIAPITTGIIHGGMTVTNEIEMLVNGWLSLGTTSRDATVQNFVDAFPTTGFPGSDFPSNLFASVNTYDETSADPATDFVVVGSAAEPLVPGLGYYVFAFGGTTYQLSHTGEINSGEVEIPVTYTDTGDPSQDGLNLISNPYPATINWNSQEGWQRENMSGVTYVWDTDQSQFRTYMNGLGTNGGSPFIKPMEAFWVVSTADNPTIMVDENAKALNDDQFSVPDEFITVSLSNESWSDQMIITASENAESTFDANFDAFKFDGLGLVPNISSLSSDGVSLAINDLPILEEATSVSIYIDIREEGEYTVGFEGVTAFMENRCISVKDLVTDEVYDLRQVSEFTFTSEVVDAEERFVLQIGDPISAEATNVTCALEATGTIHAAGSGDGPWDYAWFDEEMTLVGESLGELEAFTITDLTAGSYTVQIGNNDFCNTLSLQAEITQPEDVLIVEEFVNNIPCNQNANGEISLEISGGVQPYFVEWDNDELGANIDFLLPGTYSYVLTDAAGCVKTGTQTVTEAVDVSAAFSAEELVVMLDENGEAEFSFTNESEGADTFNWSFGEGNESDLENLVVTVDQHINVREQQLGDQINIVVDNNTVILTSNGTLGSDKIEIVIYDLLGKIISSENSSFAESKEIKLNIDEANALYVVSVVNTSTGQEFRRKISRF